MNASEKTRSALIGLFVLCAFAIVAGILLFLKPSFGNGNLSFRIRFVNIEKINVGTRVTLAGRPIGEVIRIRPVLDARITHEDPDSHSKSVYAYELDLEVDSKTPIYYSDLFISQTSGLLGERSVAIIPQKVNGPLREIHTGELVYAHLAPSVEDTVERFGRLSYKVEEAIDSITNLLHDGAPKVHTTIDNLNASSTLLHDLLHSCQESNLAPSLASAAKETALAMRQVHHLLGALDDEATVNDLRGILHHTHHFLAALDQPQKLSDLLHQTQMTMNQFHLLGVHLNQSWPKLERAIDQMADSGSHIAQISSSARAAMEQFSKVAEHVYTGQGSLGRLLMKDDLYLDLSQTVARVNIVLSDINNYGLLFQNNRTWKLQRAYQMDKLMALREPAAFERFWKDQMYTVQSQLGQLSVMLDQAKKQSRPIDLSSNSPFQNALKGALHQLSDLQQQLVLFETRLQEPLPTTTPATIETLGVPHEPQ